MRFSKFLFFILVVAFVSSLFNLATVKADLGSDIDTTTDYVATSFGGWQPQIYNMSGRHWAFYSKNQDWVFRTSVDNGTTWSGPTVLASDNFFALVRGSGLSLDYDGTYIHYALAHGQNWIAYRRGLPISDGTITWSAPLQNYTGPVAGNELYYPCMSVNSTGYSFIGYRNKTTAAGPTYPYMIINAFNDGTFQPATGYPLQLNTTNSINWIVQPIVQLTAGKAYVLLAENATSVGGKLYTPGVGWGSWEHINNTALWKITGGSWTYATTGDDIYYAYLGVYSNDNPPAVWARCWGVAVRRFSTGWGEYAQYDNFTDLGANPVMTKMGDKNFLIWFLSGKGGDLQYRRWYNDLMDSQPTVGVEGSNADFVDAATLNAFRDLSADNTVAIAWTDNRTGSPYNIKFASFYEFNYQYIFKGVYDESSNQLKDPGERAVNVTAYYDDGTDSETFEVDTQFVYGAPSIPLYFHYELGTYDREYWLGPNEQGITLYIYNSTLTSYTINFLDLAGVLEDYPFVEAKRYMNGTLQLIEKRRVDVEKKILMSLVNGVKYNLIIQNGATYTYGDLLMTSVQTVTLTLKGIEFPREVELTYKYVRIYGTRSWDVGGTGNITITYEDLLALTTDVDIYINYRNGTNAYNTTIASDSFNHVWASALNNTDYAVICEINHQRYGTYEWRQFFPRTFSDPPFGLDFLGPSLPFATSIIIPMFLILFVAGCFSQVNAEVGAFMAVVTAIILTYMGWLVIPSGVLITAFCLAILMALIFAKRKVHPY